LVQQKNEECEKHTELYEVTCCLPLDDHEDGLNVSQWDWKWWYWPHCTWISALCARWSSGRNFQGNRRTAPRRTLWK